MKAMKKYRQGGNAGKDEVGKRKDERAVKNRQKIIYL